MKKEDKYFIYDRPYEQTFKMHLNIQKSRMKAFGYRALMNVWYPKHHSEKKYNVSVCAIFKNEAPYLKEWIEYHKLIGVNHFYLYNNFSEDHFEQILQPYVDAGDVSLMDWPYEQGQMAAYKDCVKNFKEESRWIGFIDLDEFIVPIDDDNLYDFLRRFEKNRGSVILYWKFFGSSGKIRRDEMGLVTEDFVISWRKHTNLGKCFFNTAYDFLPEYEKNGILHHSMWTGCRGKALPPVNCFDRVCIDGANFASTEHFPIQLNHYFTKSLVEWETGKQAKGDVYFKKNPHDEAYFLMHERKCGAVDVSIYKYLIPLKKALDCNK